MTTLPKYERYKDSEIEWADTIPSHWDVKPGRVTLSLNKEKNAGNIEETVLSLSYGRLVIKPPEKMTGLVPESLEGYQIINPGDIIIRPTDLQNDWTSLRVGLAKNRGIITSAYLGLKHDEKVSSEYLYYLLHSYDLLKVYYGMGTGLRQNLSWDDFKYLPLTLPPKFEQDRIVAFLDQKTAEIDALIAKKQRQIELLDEQKAILINRAVTRGLVSNVKLKPSGVEWIADIPEHWDVKRLRYLCVVGTGERDTKNSIPDGEYPFFVRSQTPEQINSYGFDCEAVLTAGDGAGVGKVFHHFVGKFDAHQRVYVMRDFVEVLGRYFFLFLRQNFHRVALTGDAKSTVDSLRRSMLTDFPIPVPPEDEQLAIIKHCDEISEKIADLGKTTLKEIQSLKTLRSTLIAHAVTGRIKV